MKINHIIWVFLFGVLVFNLSAQNSSDIEKQKEARRKRQFRIAQRYQQSGMHDNAIIILKKLYTQVPGRIQYYQELLESLIALSRIEEALILIDAQEAIDSLNPRYEIDKGSVLYKAQKEKEAKKIWGAALDKHSENVAIYTMVANAMLNHGLFEEAVKVYEKGYKQHPDRTYFLQNIASLYRNKYQYTESLKYYLAYLKIEPKRAQSVTRQVLSFKLEPEQADSLIQILEKEAKRNKDRVEIQNLVAKFYQKYQKYEEALEIYKKLENENTQGKYLLQFGRVMQADSAYSLALLAYMEVINRFPNSPDILFAYLGAAKSNLELAQLRNDQNNAEQAIIMINKVREKYPNHPDAAELSLVEGLIYKRFFFDIDRAIHIFNDVVKAYPQNVKILENANLFLGECYIIRGNLPQAISSLTKVNINPNKPQALFYLAKIEYYSGDYSACKNYLNTIILQQGVSGEITNDALELGMLLNHSEKYPKALEFYAQADWLLFQQKKSEAISKLENALQQEAPKNLRAKILILAAEISAEIGKTIEALEFCNTFIEDESLSLYADAALFVMAGILEQKIGDLTQAYQVYDTLLIKYPNSQYNHLARSKLKNLREKLQEAVP